MPMDRSKYPPDWDDISRQVREEAGDRCKIPYECVGFWYSKQNGAGVSRTHSAPNHSSCLRGARAMREPTPSSEIWLPVVGYEGVYSVSSRGRVRRDLANRGTKAGNILAQSMKRGYPMVSLSRDNHRRNHLVHILVAEAFIGPRLPGFEVNHKDGNRTNADAVNLEYVTRRENLLHAQQTMGSYRGERHPNSKLTTAAVLEIRRIAPRSELACRDLAGRFGVSWLIIQRVARGKGWEHVSEAIAATGQQGLL